MLVPYILPEAMRRTMRHAMRLSDRRVEGESTRENQREVEEYWCQQGKAEMIVGGQMKIRRCKDWCRLSVGLSVCREESVDS